MKNQPFPEPIVSLAHLQTLAIGLAAVGLTWLAVTTIAAPDDGPPTDGATTTTASSAPPSPAEPATPTTTHEAKARPPDSCPAIDTETRLLAPNHIVDALHRLPPDPTADRARLQEIWDTATQGTTE